MQHVTNQGVACRTNVRAIFSAKFRALIGHGTRGGEALGSILQPMSSGQLKRKHPFNKTIIRDGMIVILQKNGKEKMRLPMKEKESKKNS
jgi:hypothetical protein